MRPLVTSILALASIYLSLRFAEGAGKAPPKDNGCNLPTTWVTPQPVRRVILKSVGTIPFTMPNGSRIDLTNDLNSMFLTEVTSTPSLAPIEAPSVQDPCQPYLEVRASLTSIDLNVLQVGVSFGYTGPVEHPTIVKNLTGELDVKVGAIAMDFSIWQCVRGSCSSVAAKTSDHTILGGDLIVKIDFGLVTTGPQFVMNPKMSQILRAIMHNGMAELSSSPRINELAWFSKVRSVSDSGVRIFDAGVSQRIEPNQAFVIYAATDAAGSCELFQAVEYIHTTRVDPISSVSQVDQVLDARGAKIGDIVMIRQMPSAR